MKALSALAAKDSYAVILKKDNREIILTIEEARYLSKTLRKLTGEISTKKTTSDIQNRAGAKFAVYIRKKRMEAKLSQWEVAHFFKYESAQFVSNWERGLAKPPVEQLKSLAKLYSISANDLFELYLTVEVELQTKKLVNEFQSY